MKQDFIQISLGVDVPERVTCRICKQEFITDDGLNFFVEGSETLVCHDCAEKKAPHVFQLMKEINRWYADILDAEIKKARQAEAAKIGAEIFACLYEKPEDRLRKLGQRLQTENEIPF